MSSTAVPFDVVEYLERHQKKELLRFLTCGSVDDGKSTLIGRLLHDTKTIYEDQLAAVTRDSVKHGTTGGKVDLALLTDGLKAEREQGITIDVAYRYFSTDKRKFIIADTPGHEQYTRNMATGASTCQLAIILIDARHGVMPQTRRHSYIVSLLGIKHVVVAVNKMDLVGYSEARFNEIRSAYSEFAAKLDIQDVVFIPMSALTGDNVVDKSPAMAWYKGTPLLNHLETVHIAGDRNLQDFRLPVQLVLRPNLNFRGFAGTIASGVVRVGDEVKVLPSGKRSRVKSITTFDGELSEAFAPMSVTLTLADEVDVSRGDMLVHAAATEDSPHTAQDVEAMVVWLHEKPLVPGRTYLIKHNTRSVSGEVSELRFAVDVNTMERRVQPTLSLNEVGRCRLSLNTPLVFDAYKKNRNTGALIIIDKVANSTVAAGMILDPADRDLADAWEKSSGASLVTRSSEVPVGAREERLKQKAGTILITGLTGSGKSPLAYGLEKALFDAGYLATVLYGSNMRKGISRDLGFSADERSENLRRSAEVARILNESGLICIAAFVAPHDSVREKVRKLIGAERFLEVYLSAPPAYCMVQDKTGAWEKAARGEIKSFPGLTASYDEPTRADLILPTDKISTAQAVAKVLALLKTKGWIA